MTREAYLVRVLEALLAVACLGVTLFWSVRAVGIVHSAVSSVVKIDENGP